MQPHYEFSWHILSGAKLWVSKACLLSNTAERFNDRRIIFTYSHSHINMRINIQIQISCQLDLVKWLQVKKTIEVSKSKLSDRK